MMLLAVATTPCSSQVISINRSEAAAQETGEYLWWRSTAKRNAAFGSSAIIILNSAGSFMLYIALCAHKWPLVNWNMSIFSIESVDSLGGAQNSTCTAKREKGGKNVSEAQHWLLSHLSCCIYCVLFIYLFFVQSSGVEFAPWFSVYIMSLRQWCQLLLTTCVGMLSHRRAGCCRSIVWRACIYT